MLSEEREDHLRASWLRCALSHGSVVSVQRVPVMTREANGMPVASGWVILCCKRSGSSLPRKKIHPALGLPLCFDPGQSQEGLWEREKRGIGGTQKKTKVIFWRGE